MGKIRYESFLRYDTVPQCYQVEETSWWWGRAEPMSMFMPQSAKASIRDETAGGTCAPCTSDSISLNHHVFGTVISTDITTDAINIINSITMLLDGNVAACDGALSTYTLMQTISHGTRQHRPKLETAWVGGEGACRSRAVLPLKQLLVGGHLSRSLRHTHLFFSLKRRLKQK